MIKQVYKDEKLWTYKHALWATFIFLLYSAIFEYIVFLACFYPLFARPQLYVSLPILALILADRLYIPFTTRKFLSYCCIVDLTVWVLLMLCLVLPSSC